MITSHLPTALPMICVFLPLLITGFSPKAFNYLYSLTSVANVGVEGDFTAALDVNSSRLKCRLNVWSIKWKYNPSFIYGCRYFFMRWSNNLLVLNEKLCAAAACLCCWQVLRRGVYSSFTEHQAHWESALGTRRWRIGSRERASSPAGWWYSCWHSR